MQEALSIKRAQAGRKGGKAPHKGKRGFAADKNRAAEAGRKGAQNGWRNKKSALEKYKLHFELTPGDPQLNKKRKRKP